MHGFCTGETIEPDSAIVTPKHARFQFKPKLSAVLAVLNGVAVGLAYVVSQGNITATIVWFTITTGAAVGLSYYKEKQ